MKVLNPILSGVAGEYLVAGELSRRGYIASITLRNSKGVDILASNENASKTVGIQVKTNIKNIKGDGSKTNPRGVPGFNLRPVPTM